jgi:hypothetical protein
MDGGCNLEKTLRLPRPVPQMPDASLGNEQIPAMPAYFNLGRL